MSAVALRRLLQKLVQKSLANPLRGCQSYVITNRSNRGENMDEITYKEVALSGGTMIDVFTGSKHINTMWVDSSEYRRNEVQAKPSLFNRFRKTVGLWILGDNA